MANKTNKNESNVNDFFSEFSEEDLEEISKEAALIVSNRKYDDIRNLYKHMSLLRGDELDDIEFKYRCARVILRLRSRLRAGGMICPCRCYDSTIFKGEGEHGEIWVNDGIMKIEFYGFPKSFAVRGDTFINIDFNDDKVCPICGRTVNEEEAHKSHLSNGFETY